MASVSADNFGHAVEAVGIESLVIDGLRGTSAHPDQLSPVLVRVRDHDEVRYPVDVRA